MSAYQRNVLVGAVVLVALGVLAWMVLQFANKASTFFLSSGVKITLTTPRAEGVGDGSPITYRGVNVGRVTSVRRVVSEETGDENVVIDALIDAEPRLPANLRGRIKQTSLLGASATITLEPNIESATQPAEPKGKRIYLSDSANLPAEYVPDITSLGDNIRDLTMSIQEIIGDPAVQNDVKLSLASIRDASASASRLSNQLEKISGSLDKLANESTGTIGEVRDTVKDVRVEMQKFTKNLGDRMDQVAISLQHVQSVAKKMDAGTGTAGQLVNDPKLYESLNDTASELKLMVKDMRRLIDQWEKEGIVKF